MANHVLLELWRFQGGRCAYCGRTMVDPRAGAGDRNTPLRATIDHLRPLALGGRDDGYNRVAACLECNVLKGPLHITEFIRLRWNTMLLNEAKARIRLTLDDRARMAAKERSGHAGR
ncbi:HNH endonuclease [Dongia deserti]|uniref:HNH endonuclease n=1 Tax=Dongia deserti TaxID=2268030 RepID=UPI000E65C17A|nr:HNH endonuclease [Dongia deserti]